MTQPTPLPTCPMAETCKGMMEKPISGLTMLIPGLAFIVLGVLIVIWPSILSWLVAIAFVLAGIAMLMMARFMGGVGDRLRRAGG